IPLNMGSIIPSKQSRQLTLYPHLRCVVDLRFISRISRIKPNSWPFPMKIFEGSFALVDQCDNDLAVACTFGSLEIGRASCWERVCQSVCICVVADTLKK